MIGSVPQYFVVYVINFNCKNVQQSYYQQMHSHKSMDLLNMDASVGYHFNFYDSNSSRFYPIRDDSISSESKLFRQAQVPHHTIRHFNFEDTINFHDLQKIGPTTDPVYSQQSAELSSKDEKESPDWKVKREQSQRKGLKYLSRLLLRTLNHRRSFSPGEISELINHILYKGRQSAKMSKKQIQSKEEKNIKRRIYDALNVMMAAGLLDREMKMKSTQVTADFNTDYKGQIAGMSLKIQKKKEYLQKLQSQRKALQYWIVRNKQKIELDNSVEKMIFPLIFVINSSGEEMWKEYEQQFLMIKNRGLQFLSETDLIELVKEENLLNDSAESNQ